MFALAVAIVGTINMSCSSASFPATPLFEGIDQAEYEQGRDIIQQRVVNKFPIGASETGLADYLESQGLEVKRTENVGLPELPIFGQSSVTKSRGICDIAVGVDWRADRNGIIRDISARYSDVGCM